MNTKKNILTSICNQWGFRTPLTTIVEKLAMTVRSASELFAVLLSSKYLSLCSPEQRYLYRFEKTQQGDNYDRNVILG